MSDPAAPRAPRRPTVLRHGDDERVDDWYWLRERDDPEVLAYLKAENEHTEAGLAPTAELRARLFSEIKGRVRETDVSAPVRRHSWEYYTRTIEGRGYAVHCRRPIGTPRAPDPDTAPGVTPGEQVVLDENALAAPHDYFVLRGLSIAPDQRLLAYTVDVVLYVVLDSLVPRSHASRRVRRRIGSDEVHLGRQLRFRRDHDQRAAARSADRDVEAFVVLLEHEDVVGDRRPHDMAPHLMRTHGRVGAHVEDGA